MAEIRTSHLFTLKLAVSGLQPIGETPAGNRRVGLVAGGTFEGPKLRGTVLPGGADWIIGRPDGVTTLDVRLVLETHDKASIGMTYRGLRHGPAEVMARLARGETPGRDEYFFRTLMRFTTGAPQWLHLNKVLALAVGQREARAVLLDVYRIT